MKYVYDILYICTDSRYHLIVLVDTYTLGFKDSMIAATVNWSFEYQPTLVEPVIVRLDECKPLIL